MPPKSRYVVAPEILYFCRSVREDSQLLPKLGMGVCCHCNPSVGYAVVKRNIFYVKLTTVFLAVFVLLLSAPFPLTTKNRFIASTLKDTTVLQETLWNIMDIITTTIRFPLWIGTITSKARRSSKLVQMGFLTGRCFTKNNAHTLKTSVSCGLLPYITDSCNVVPLETEGVVMLMQIFLAIKKL